MKYKLSTIIILTAALFFNGCGKPKSDYEQAIELRENAVKCLNNASLSIFYRYTSSIEANDAIYEYNDFIESKKLIGFKPISYLNTR